MKDQVDLPDMPLGTYLHTKSGHHYEVIGVALQTETNEALVVYRPLWDSKYALFARPYDMFMQTIEIDGLQVPRFEKISD
jgi:hypothetical protein